MNWITQDQRLNSEIWEYNQQIVAEQRDIMKKAIVHARSFSVLRICRFARYTFANHIGQCYQVVFHLNSISFVS
ncbi:hypothetical protein BDA96_01G420200 [Sorghum bicolor]|uniref:Uncharacterized protein n=2 Tax=Sorghum bicolor TaxID=4558 RepID=A0A921S4B6_SORBI|nr:hypothetical protein BDA96_02G183200 [Sorghum bicolor]KAG0551401.1 hypothetical protein BDA96_01G420200 [Sorghum bicolor]OQU86389.1 hypothetical protein SORBI_3003G084501 [Sorghum bicolor]OQU92715.1 hypothetical protein SORBI_3001G395150 [Sorghum bicolor]